jgi:hypothetical protein
VVAVVAKGRGEGNGVEALISHAGKVLGVVGRKRNKIFDLDREIRENSKHVGPP